jgi:dual specificity phosphatase 12
MPGRPQAQPNYGFTKQLDIFEKCGYEPLISHPHYRSWKRRHVQDVNNYFNHLIDTVAIVPDKLLLTRFVLNHHLSILYSYPAILSEFPDDPKKAQSLLIEMGVTHILSISPSENTSSFASVMNHHVITNGQSPEALLLVLPSICDYIRDSVKKNGLVLVHCRIESRACTAVCAYRKCFLLFKTVLLFVFSNVGRKLIRTSILCDTKWSVLYVFVVPVAHRPYS